jgi:RNA polymerase sigma-B factor
MRYGCGFDYSDLYQSGMLGLVKGTKNYNGRAIFSTWASWCIIREIRHFVRGECDYFMSPAGAEADKEAVSAKAGVYNIDFYENEVSKGLCDYQSVYLAVENRIALEQAFKNLSGLQREVIDLLYYRELTQEQTAQALGLNQRKVSRVKHKALVSLSAMMAEPYVKVG